MKKNFPTKFSLSPKHARATQMTKLDILNLLYHSINLGTYHTCRVRVTLHTMIQACNARNAVLFLSALRFSVSPLVICLCCKLNWERIQYTLLYHKLVLHRLINE